MIHQPDDPGGDTADTDGTSLVSDEADNGEGQSRRAAKVLPFGRPTPVGAQIKDRKWDDYIAMLEDVIKDIKSGKVKPNGAVVILYENDPAREYENTPFWTMGLNRIEVVGILNELSYSLSLPSYVGTVLPPR